MVNKSVRLVVLCLLSLVMLAGCAALKMEGVMFDLNSIVPPDAAAKNAQVATTIGEVKDAWGQNSRVSVTWQVQNGVWILVDAKQASGTGMGQSVGTAVAGSLPMAISLPIAARQLRPDTTNVNQTGGGATAATGPITNVNTALGGVGGQGGSGGLGGGGGQGGSGGQGGQGNNGIGSQGNNGQGGGGGAAGNPGGNN